jgi:hypothetical protein
MQFVELVSRMTENVFATVVWMQPGPLRCPTRLGVLIFAPSKTACPNPHAGIPILLVDEQVGRVWFLTGLRLLCRSELLKSVAELAAEIDGETFNFLP